MFDALLDRDRTPREQALIDEAGGQEAFEEEVHQYMEVSGVTMEAGRPDDQFDAAYVQFLTRFNA